jgi:uncharacterized membrane protein YhhN
MMPSMRSPLLIAAVAALAIIGSTLGGAALWLHYLCKPLATLLMLHLAWRAAPPVSPAYRRAVLAGLCLSLLGDVALMLPSSVLAPGFELGLASFLLAHLCFLRALTRDARLFGRPLALIVLLVISVANMRVLWPHIGAALHIPVLAYMLCLVAMTAQAASRMGSLGTPDSRQAALGALCFLVSDTSLAYNKFYAPIPASPLIVLGTYYLALYLIARSVQRAR